jgi:hypothetical protein
MYTVMVSVIKISNLRIASSLNTVFVFLHKYRSGPVLVYFLDEESEVFARQINPITSSYTSASPE